MSSSVISYSSATAAMDMPPASLATISSTGTRVPAITGLPKRTLGSTTMRGAISLPMWYLLPWTECIRRQNVPAYDRGDRSQLIVQSPERLAVLREAGLGPVAVVLQLVVGGSLGEPVLDEGVERLAALLALLARPLALALGRRGVEYERGGLVDDPVDVARDLVRDKIRPEVVEHKRRLALEHVAVAAAAAHAQHEDVAGRAGLGGLRGGLEAVLAGDGLLARQLVLAQLQARVARRQELQRVGVVDHQARVRRARVAAEQPGVVAQAVAGAARGEEAARPRRRHADLHARRTAAVAPEAVKVLVD